MQILDPLHYSELNMNKTIFKHGLLNNASDDARSQISKQLSEWKHPLDTRRKNDNRNRSQKWFTGERWGTFAAGVRGSPGGPKAIAVLVKIIADDLQLRGAASGSAVGGVEPDAETQLVQLAGGRGGGRAAGRGRGRSSFNQRLGTTATTTAAGTALVVTRPQASHIPCTAVEQGADPDDLNVIRELYGSRAQTLINVLLAFDAYFSWYYPLKESIPLTSERAEREERALSNCQAAIDLHEITERLTARGLKGHRSFLFHGAIFKVTRDILEVGDVWAFGTSPLELQNAGNEARRRVFRVAASDDDGREVFDLHGYLHTPPPACH